MLKIHEALNKTNWMKGGLGNGPAFSSASRLCLFGWLLHVGRSPLEQALKQAITTLFPDRAPDGNIVQFNDHPATTVEDVIRVCKLADI